jgi:predicted kinase
MPDLIITKGLPASGKSTWAKEYVLANKDTVRINNDELGDMLCGEVFSKRDSIIKGARNQLLDFYMTKGLNIIIDNTNLHPDREKEYREKVEQFNNEQFNLKKIVYTLKVKDFTDVPVQACIIRNASRVKAVPEKVIYQMYQKYIAEGIVKEQDKKLPWGLVCDLDGTIAHHGNRCIYDTTKYDQDELILPVWKVVETLWQELSSLGTKLIFLTGRDEDGRAQTVKWLNEKCSLEPEDYILLMRPAKDKTPDYEFKEQIFNEQIEGKYYVAAWFEDRFRNIMMARGKLGLVPVFQVGDGSF